MNAKDVETWLFVDTVVTLMVSDLCAAMERI